LETLVSEAETGGSEAFPLGTKSYQMALSRPTIAGFKFHSVTNKIKTKTFRLAIGESFPKLFFRQRQN
jgi:hypothetical protein